MEQAEAKEDDNHAALLPLLESLRAASQDLQGSSNPIFFASHCSPALYSTVESLLPQIETLLTLSNQVPKLFKLAQVLCSLKTLLRDLKDSQGYTLTSILRRQLISYKIYQASFEVEAEIEHYIDRERVKRLVNTLRDEWGAGYSKEDKLRVLKDLEKRLSQGFDRGFQEVVLKGKVFYVLEELLSDPGCDTKIRELAAACLLALVRFNKDVFVGLVLMGPTVAALISMASGLSVRVLCSLIKLIKTPLVDEMECSGEIPRVVRLLASRDVGVRVGGVGCVCEVAYVGRKEVVKALLELGVVEKLVELERWSDQRSGKRCNRVDDSEEMEMEEGEEMVSGRSPFSGCVLRFAVQVEAGEGLSGKERKEFKLEILRRVREASVSQAEAASIVAEVLWGSSP